MDGLQPPFSGALGVLMTFSLTVFELLGGVGLLILIVLACGSTLVKLVSAKVLKDYQASLNFSATKREKAALVAELLAEWVSFPEDKRKLNQLLWEATLWLPEKEAKELNDLLAHQGNITTKDLIVNIRSIIQEEKSNLTSNDITSF